MDCDGDKGLITKHPVIVNAVNTTLPLIDDDGPKDAIAKVWDREHLIQHFVNTSKRNQVGVITNLSTRINEIGICDKDRMKTEKHMIALRLLQGWEIDSAKHGERVVIPDYLTTKRYNTWFADMNGKLDENGQAKSKKMIVTHIASPMQNNYDFMKDYIERLNVLTTNNIDMSIRFIDTNKVEHNELLEILPLVKDLESKYRGELNRIHSDNVISEEDAQKLRTVLYEEYTMLLQDLCKGKDYKTDIEMLTAAASYNVCYNRDDHNTDSISFVWTCAFNGLLKLLYSDKSSMLTRISGVEEVNSFEIKNHVIYINNSMYMTLTADKNGFYRYNDGNYDIVEIDGEYFFKAPKSIDIFTEVASSSETVVNSNTIITDKPQVKLNFSGFKYYDNDNYTVSFIEKIFNNNLEMNLIDVNGKMTVFVDNKAIGVVSKKDNLVLARLLDGHDAVKLQVINNHEKKSNDEYKDLLISQLKYVPKEIRKTTVMFDENFAMYQNVTLTVVNVGEITELPKSITESSSANSPVLDETYPDDMYSDDMMYPMDDIAAQVEDMMMVAPIDDNSNAITTIDFVNKKVVKFYDMSNATMNSVEAYNSISDFDYLVLYKKNMIVLYNNEGQNKAYSATLEQAKSYAEKISK